MLASPRFPTYILVSGMSFLRLIFFLPVVSLDLLVPNFASSKVLSLQFLFKVGMSFLRLIFFLAVAGVSLGLLVLSLILASPRFPAYMFS